MPLIPVRCPGSQDPMEWGGIELQGELECEEGVNPDGLKFCTMAMEGKGTPVLYFGNHKIEGREVELKKPLAILHKRRRECAEGEDASPAPDAPLREAEGRAGEAARGAGDVEYEVVGVLRRKYIFKTRPKPLPVSSKQQPAPTKAPAAPDKPAASLGKAKGEHGGKATT
eukprot:tig00000983_g5914.t1